MYGSDYAALIVERNNERAHIYQVVQLYEYAVSKACHHILGIEVVKVSHSRYL